MSSPSRIDPYADAPRLPEGEILSLEALVPGVGPVELEVGPGHGGFIQERLQADPMVRLVGLEVRRKWATIVDRRLKRDGLGGRARVYAEDARDALPRFPPASVRLLCVHFPDPWWKKRHQKRLVIAADTLPLFDRVLAPGGQLFIQTDVAERAEAYETLVLRHGGFRPCPGGPWISENPFQARSPRERRALDDGLPVHRLLFLRSNGATVESPASLWKSHSA